jgi:hypothetical protein
LGIEGIDEFFDFLLGDIVYADFPVFGIRDTAEVSLVELGDADTDVVVFRIECDGILERVVAGGVVYDTVDGRGSFVVDIVVALWCTERQALESREQFGLDVLEETVVELLDGL